jgi:hypothetical protein
MTTTEAQPKTNYGVKYYERTLYYTIIRGITVRVIFYTNSRNEDRFRYVVSFPSDRIPYTVKRNWMIPRKGQPCGPKFPNYPLQAINFFIKPKQFKYIFANGYGIIAVETVPAIRTEEMTINFVLDRIKKVIDDIAEKFPFLVTDGDITSNPENLEQTELLI